MLGGGNPGHIPQVQTYLRERMKKILENGDEFERLIGSYGRFGPSRLDPLLIRDRGAARECLEHILTWDFDRIVVAHGDDILETGGQEALRSGFAWLLAS